MNSIEYQMLDVLTELKEKYGVFEIKAEFETEFTVNDGFQFVGQFDASKGHEGTQCVENRTVGENDNVGLGTNHEHGNKPLGQLKSIRGTQQEHNRNALESLSPGLDRLVSLWSFLPDILRQGILAMAEAAIKK